MILNGWSNKKYVLYKILNGSRWIKMDQACEVLDGHISIAKWGQWAVERDRADSFAGGLHLSSILQRLLNVLKKHWFLQCVLSISFLQFIYTTDRLCFTLKATSWITAVNKNAYNKYYNKFYLLSTYYSLLEFELEYFHGWLKWLSRKYHALSLLSPTETKVCTGLVLDAFQ